MLLHADERTLSREMRESEVLCPAFVMLRGAEDHASHSRISKMPPFPTGSSPSDLPQRKLRTIPKLMFSLRYRNDPGLAFLQFCAHADLKDLADILMTE